MSTDTSVSILSMNDRGKTKNLFIIYYNQTTSFVANFIETWVPSIEDNIKENLENMQSILSP